jgi:hypothetical protein
MDLQGYNVSISSRSGRRDSHRIKFNENYKRFI